MTTVIAGTCSTACWYAKEPACNCQCGGPNHGIMRVEGAEQPGRTRRIKDRLYRLEAVLTSWVEASKLTFELQAKAPRLISRWGGHEYTDDKAAFRLQASDTQLAKWSEVANVAATMTQEGPGKPKPYLVWLCTGRVGDNGRPQEKNEGGIA